MAERKMKPLKAWAHVGGTNEILDLGLKLPIFNNKREAKLYLCGMEKHGYRIARVEIREVKRVTALCIAALRAREGM